MNFKKLLVSVLIFYVGCYLAVLTLQAALQKVSLPPFFSWKTFFLSMVLMLSLVLLTRSYARIDYWIKKGM